MKYLLAFILACSLPAFATDTKPIVKDGYVIRTLQQDAELKDWIQGLQAENLKTSQRADAADKHETEALVALRDSQQKAAALQAQADKDLARAQKAESERDVETRARRKAELALWEWRIGFWSAVGIGLLVTFRKPIAALFGIPMPL